MLGVRGSNPDTPSKKNTTYIPETKLLFGARRVVPILYWGRHQVQPPLSKKWPIDFFADIDLSKYFICTWLTTHDTQTKADALNTRV